MSAHWWDVIECSARPGVHWYFTCACGVISQCWPDERTAVQMAEVGHGLNRADNKTLCQAEGTNRDETGVR